MGMIKFKQKGDFKKAMDYFSSVKDLIGKETTLHMYGLKGVQALQSVTPKDTGETAKSWYYKIVQEGEKVKIQFCNTNVKDGVNIAVVLQYGHGTRNGGYVEGRDYINPAIQPIFDEMANKIWKEVAKG